MSGEDERREAQQRADEARRVADQKSREAQRQAQIDRDQKAREKINRPN